MRKFTLIIFLIGATLGLTACQSHNPTNNQAAQTSSINHTMSTYDLQHQYVAITDAVMKPVSLVNQHQQNDDKQLKDDLDSATQKIDQAKSELKQNKTHQQLTQALLVYRKTAANLLTAIKDSDNNAYSRQFISLDRQAAKLAKKYFNNHRPDSLEKVLKYQAENNTYASGNVLNTKKFQIKFNKVQIVGTDDNQRVILLTYTFHNKSDTPLTPATILNDYGEFKQDTTTLQEGEPATSYQQSNPDYTTAQQQAQQAVAPGETATAIIGLTLKDKTTTVDYNGITPKNQQPIGTISIKLTTS
ncbi:DUF5067 domain-containing protein [Loigolactobacillus rennini]|uniref:DUF5067 domain-containing protein n=1 Tax=Loigolactobacillus rennini DSM 20253 TaxID=1423796 RepID=A0A0R2D1V1_9LACO|nr:DUF5067 domain-containing protein [Loigolactobacillus rennini]KRM97685.1 hypothetical protein FC24_GL001449 [Loigolactobacillus rennini DSM 20253]